MTPTRILVCGLPGSGKSTLAQELADAIGAVWLDGDAVRKASGNTDFGLAGRIEQSRDMRRLADMFNDTGQTVVASFVCPTIETRAMFMADYTIYMDTIVASPYQDTNALFMPPHEPNWTVSTWDKVENMVSDIRLHWLDTAQFNPVRPSAVMIGRFQPWHAGHRALFEVALAKYGQVLILIRNTPIDDNNPYSLQERFDRINRDLKEFQGKFTVECIPNVAAVVYGRDVGYGIDEIRLPEDVEKISATRIRRNTTGVFS